MYLSIAPMLKSSSMLKSKFKLRRCLHICLCLFLLLPFIFCIFESIPHFFKLGTAFLQSLVGDNKHCVNILKSGGLSDCPVINSYNYSYLSNCETKCQNDTNKPLKLVFVVKSRLDNFMSRSAIRKSWGSEKRFPDVPIRTVFLLGVETKMSDFQRKIERESKIYGDIIQANFIDDYWNNTIKTMMGMQWVVKFCSNSKFYAFADDDMYVSTKNVLRYLRNPFNYPEYFQNHNFSLQEDSELPYNVKFYAGKLGPQIPIRKSNDKWYVPESEYPHKMYPRFIRAGFYFLSFNALTDLYFGSFYTQHFRMDDVYLGLIAEKMDLERSSCNEVIDVWGNPYSRNGFQNVIACHGYRDPNDMLKVWNDQKLAGFA